MDNLNYYRILYTYLVEHPDPQMMTDQARNFYTLKMGDLIKKLKISTYFKKSAQSVGNTFYLFLIDRPIS